VEVAGTALKRRKDPPPAHFCVQVAEAGTMLKSKGIIKAMALARSWHYDVWNVRQQLLVGFKARFRRPGGHTLGLPRRKLTSAFFASTSEERMQPISPLGLMLVLLSIKEEVRPGETSPLL